MKIVYIGHSYIVKMNQQKIDEINRISDHQIYLVTPKRWKNVMIRGFSAGSDKEPGVHYLDVKRPGNMKKYTYKGLLSVLKKIQPDIIHIDEEPWFYVAFQIIFLAKYFLKKKPKIVLFTWENIYKKFSPRYRFIERFNLKNCDTIIAGNREASGIVKRKRAGCPVHILPLVGVDLKDYSSSKIRSKKVRIGFIGRLVREKGILLLLSAFFRLTVKNKTLTIIGQGPLLKDIRDIIKKSGHSKEVSVLTGVKHHQVPALFKKMDILVLPSCSTRAWKEQFGHVLIEAMAGRVALLGSSSGAIPEVIRDAGMIFKENNVNDLYKKLDQLVRKKKLRNMYSKKGHERVQKHYTNEVLAEETLKIYNNIS
ncbi:MAG: glycosyltransferase family 4 protein [Spirochaetes bacterium]|nr:glycosyltransferase family 4 protein [Spirochaetota bacterium]